MTGYPPNSDDDRRQRRLSDADITAITDALSHHGQSFCRFDGITQQDLLEAVRFYKNFNDTIDASKKTVLNSLLVLLISGIIGLMGLGILHKIDKGGQ